jgi:hypothetical protein
MEGGCLKEAHAQKPEIEKGDEVEQEESRID